MTNDTPEFLMIQASGAEFFAAQVNKAISDGFNPIGEPASFVVVDKLVHTQAMIKNPIPKPSGE